MIEVVRAAVGPLIQRWAQAEPATDLIRSGYAQLGFLALLLAGGWWAIKQADKRTVAAQEACKEALAEANARTAAAEKRAEIAEADGRVVRDVFIKEVVPTQALQTARFEQVLEGLQSVLALVQRVMTTALERPK